MVLKEQIEKLKLQQPIGPTFFERHSVLKLGSKWWVKEPPKKNKMFAININGQ